MLRGILYLLASIFVIALLRGIIGIITKSVGHLFEEERAARPPRPGTQGIGGELIKCSACGVFFSPATGVKAMIASKTLTFCSQACRDKMAS